MFSTPRFPNVYVSHDHGTRYEFGFRLQSSPFPSVLSLFWDLLQDPTLCSAPCLFCLLQSVLVSLLFLVFSDLDVLKIHYHAFWRMPLNLGLFGVFSWLAGVADFGKKTAEVKSTAPPSHRTREDLIVTWLITGDVSLDPFVEVLSARLPRSSYYLSLSILC